MGPRLECPGAAWRPETANQEKPGQAREKGCNFRRFRGLAKSIYSDLEPNFLRPGSRLETPKSGRGMEPVFRARRGRARSQDGSWDWLALLRRRLAGHCNVNCFFRDLACPLGDGGFGFGGIGRKGAAATAFRSWAMNERVWLCRSSRGEEFSSGAPL